MAAKENVVMDTEPPLPPTELSTDTADPPPQPPLPLQNPEDEATPCTDVPPPPPEDSDQTLPPPPLPPAPSLSGEGGDSAPPVSSQSSQRGIKRCDFDTDSGDNERKAEPASKKARGEDAVRSDFRVIDDIGSEEEGEEGREESREGADSDADSDWLQDEEIDALLDEPVKDYKAQKEDEMTIRHRSVLVEKHHDPFDILPAGWVMITHDSGMPIYLHRESRVVSASRPYFIGTASSRKHDIPQSAVPCLDYRRALDAETKEALKKDGSGDAPSKDTPAATQNGGECPMRAKAADGKCPASENQDPPSEQAEKEPSKEPEETSETAKKESPTDESTKPKPDSEPAKSEGAQDAACNGLPELSKEALALKAAKNVKVAKADEYSKQFNVSPQAFQEYCQSLFQFKTITIKRFRTWKARRAHKSEQRRQRPSLPASTKLIKCQVMEPEGGHAGNVPFKRNKEVLLNIKGKSSICILHEYVQHALRTQPKFTFAEMENAQTPFSCTVSIDSMQYGVGYGNSKKMAKNVAARNSLRVLLPDLISELDESPEPAKVDTGNLSLFDEIVIEDPRVTELCNKAGQPNPYTILHECINRNYGLCDMTIKMDMKNLSHQRHEFMMSVGKHETTVQVRNKREGKQLAAQKILKLLHPHVPCWGSILRLYSNTKTFKEKKAEEQSITELQTKSSQPNKAILGKLREEMLKLQEKRTEIKDRMTGIFNIETSEFKFTEPNSLDA